MKISKSLGDLLANHAHLEFGYGLTYRNIANYFQRGNYSGSAVFFNHEADLEIVHSKQMMSFLVNRYYDIQISKVKNDISTPSNMMDCFETFYKMECENVERINNLVISATTEKDNLANEFLLPYLKFAQEHALEAKLIRAKAKTYLGVPGLYFHFDRELSKHEVQFHE